MSSKALRLMVLGAWVVGVLGFAALAALAASNPPGSKGRTGVTVYLTDDVSDQQRREIRNTLESFDGVRALTYVSQTDAFAEFKKLYKNQPELWKGRGAQVLPASFRVKVETSGAAKRVVSALRETAGVEEVAAFPATPAERLDRVASLQTWRNRWGMGALIALTSLTVGVTLGLRARHTYE